MDTQNRLLAMLNSATSPPPPPSQPQSSNNLPSPPPGTTHQQAITSPTPSIQAVSLQDLFKSISSPPSAQPSVQDTALPPQQEHQAQLLGMFNKLGSPPASGMSLPGQSAGRVASGSGTPDLSGVQGQGQQQNLLNLLRTTSVFPFPMELGLMMLVRPASSNPQQLVISHPSTPSAALSPPMNTAVPPSSATQASPLARSPEVRNPPAASKPPAPPQKSIFDFVSPFDVFDKPKPTSKAASPAPTQVKKEQKLTPAAPTKTKGLSSPRIATSPKQTATLPKPLSHANVQASDRQSPSTSSVASVSGPSKPDIGLVWQVSKVVEQGVEGKGPKRLSAHTVIDVSEPNIDALVNTPGAVQVMPTTIRKADHIAFTQGRSVGITSAWMAYLLSKGMSWELRLILLVLTITGRIRLIDRTSGAKLVLQLPLSASQGMTVDIAVTSTRVAAIGGDGSVTVFGVPPSWDRDDPPCDTLLHIESSRDMGQQYDDEEQKGSTQSIGDTKQIEWVRKDGGESLVIGGSAGVIIVSPSAYMGKDIDMADLVRSNKVLRAEGVSDIYGQYT